MTIEEEIKEVIEEALDDVQPPETPLVPEHNHPRYDEAIAGIEGRLDTLGDMVSSLATPPVEVIEVPIEPIEEELEVPPDEEIEEIVVPPEEPETPPEEPETPPEEEPEIEDSKPRSWWDRFWG